MILEGIFCLGFGWVITELYLLNKKFKEMSITLSGVKVLSSAADFKQEIENHVMAAIKPIGAVVQPEPRPRKPKKGSRPPKTEEQRKAASEKAKERWARKRAQKAAPAPEVIAL
jgi:hypothetical protein